MAEEVQEVVIKVLPCHRCGRDIPLEEWIEDPLSGKLAVRHMGPARWAKDDRTCGYRMTALPRVDLA